MFLAPAILVVLAQAPVVDGTLGDAEWAGALEPGPLVQQFPVEGAEPSRRTRIRMRFDERTIYFAFECEDDGPEAVVARLTRRDRDTGADFISIDIDPRGDAQRAFHFEVNAAGVQRDAIRTGDSSLDFDWDAVWRSAVRVGPHGWVAEVALPLAALRFEDGHESAWRFQFRRFIARLNEVDAWVRIPRSENGEMLRYQPLAGLPAFSPPRGIELRPFGVARVRLRSGPDQPLGVDFMPSLGLDARVGLTSGVSLDATVLPDFGQVEADRALLNLSTFEVHFPEKRPFFIEGADLFALKDVNGDPLATQLFYSRRLGAPVAFDAPAGFTVGASPDVTRIWGAAKVTGRISDTWNVALLDGVTASEEAVLSDTSGAKTRLPLTVTTNYAVARLGKVLPAGFTVGASLADVRHVEPPGFQFSGVCISGDAPGPDGRCTHDSTTASVDGTWRSPQGTWASTAALWLSSRQGGPEHLVRDGTVLKAGDVGFGGRLEAAKVGGTLIGDVVFESYSPQFDLNDAGFLATQNLHRLFTQFGFRLLDVGPARETRTTIELFGRNSWDGVPIARGVQLNNLTTWCNFWQSWIELQLFPQTFDNRETHDGARYERPPQFGVEWSLTTNPSRAVVFGTDGLAHTTWRGIDVEANVAISVRPAGQWEVGLEPTLVRVTGDPRWVDTLATAQGSDYRFGLQDALATGATLRATWTMTPTLSIQAYGQLFFATVRYGELFHVEAQQARPWLTLAALQPIPGGGHDYDERETVLNASVVFRWEYLPGSVLFLVYSHSQGGAPIGVSASGSPRLDFSSIGRVPASDVFMAKLTYFFSR